MRALLTAAALSMVFTLVLTPLFVKLFHRLQWGQFIRDDGPQSHHAKRGTATMGGIVIIVAVLFGYFVSMLINQQRPSVSALLVLFMMVGLGIVGFIDDLLKTRKQRSLGLGGWAKVLGQVIVASAFAVLALQFPRAGPRGIEVTPASTSISVLRDVPIDFMVIGAIPVVGFVLYLVWINLITTAASNGVNVTDGLDGLASGATILAIGSYLVIGFWQFNQSCFSRALDPDNAYKCYDVRDPLDPRDRRRVDRRCADRVSSGGTPPRPPSSSATPARSRSAVRSRRSPCSRAPSSSSSSSAGCSSSRPDR